METTKDSPSRPIIDTPYPEGEASALSACNFKHCLYLVSLWLMTASISCSADQTWVSGLVVGVTDGDTVTILDAQNTQTEVRLFAIDAPETTCHAKASELADNQCIDKGQPFAKASKRNLSKLIYNRHVEVRLGQGSSYGRAIGTIFLNGQDINLQQVIDGYAWHAIAYAKYQSESDRASYNQAENMAQSYQSGLWSDSHPIAPWDYRKSRRAIP